MPSLRTPWFFLILCAIPLAVVFASGKNSDTNFDLLALEMQRYQAMVATDLIFLNEILDDRLIFTHASGKIDGKESFITSLSSGDLNYKNIRIEDAEVRMYDFCGIVAGKLLIEIRVRGEERKLALRFTSIWVKQQTDWKIVAYQSTRTP